MSLGKRGKITDFFPVKKRPKREETTDTEKCYRELRQVVRTISVYDFEQESRPGAPCSLTSINKGHKTNLMSGSEVLWFSTTPQKREKVTFQLDFGAFYERFISSGKYRVFFVDALSMGILYTSLSSSSSSTAASIFSSSSSSTSSHSSSSSSTSSHSSSPSSTSSSSFSFPTSSSRFRFLIAPVTCRDHEPYDPSVQTEKWTPWRYDPTTRTHRYFWRSSSTSSQNDLDFFLRLLEDDAKATLEMCDRNGGDEGGKENKDKEEETGRKENERDGGIMKSDEEKTVEINQSEREYTKEDG